MKKTLSVVLLSAIILLLLGCPPTAGGGGTTGGNGGNTGGDGGTETPGGEKLIKEIRFSNPTGEALTHNDNLTWGNIWQIISPTVTQELDSLFGANNWELSTNLSESYYDGIDIFDGFESITDEELAALNALLSDTFDCSVADYSSWSSNENFGYDYDFSATYDSATGYVVVTYDETEISVEKETDYYLAADVWFYDTDGQSFHEVDWAEIYLLLNAQGITNIFNNIYGTDNWYEREFAEGWFVGEDYFELFSKDGYAAMLSSLDTALDCSASGTMYDFVASKGDYGKVEVALTKTALPDGEASDYYYYGGYSFKDTIGEKLDYYSSPSADTFTYILKEKGFNDALTNSISSNLSSKLWTQESYNEFLNFFNGELTFKVAGLTFGAFIPTYDSRAERFTINYTSTEITDGSDSEYYEVDKISLHYLSGYEFDYLEHKLWTILQSRMLTPLDTAFGSGNWSASTNSPTFSINIYEGSEVITHDAITLLMETFNTVMDANISNQIFNFETRHSVDYKTFYIDYDYVPITDGSSSIAYIVDSIFFLDKDGNTFKDDGNSIRWESNLWPAIKPDASAIFNTELGAEGDGWHDKTSTSWISVNDSIMNHNTYTTLMTELETLTFEYGGKQYSFSTSFDFDSQRINVTVAHP